MISGIGIDIVEISRIEEIFTRQTRFAAKILTEQEFKQFNKYTTDKRKNEFLAGRFAAKEAFAKAYGTGIGKLGFRDIEVTTNKHGAPLIQSAFTMDMHVHVSISHSENYAIAQVVIESK